MDVWKLLTTKIILYMQYVTSVWTQLCHKVKENSKYPILFIMVKIHILNIFFFIAFVFNSVVTGLRFIIINHTLYPQIQQGQLINGTIDNNTVEWRNSSSLNSESGTGNITTIDNYHKSVCLDDITLPQGYVVTG